ncbi:hypothetical protein D918_02821, partial [Trichuris suis]
LKQAREVPSYRIPWNRKYYRYNPKHWDETCRFDECDPDIKSPVFHPKFNTIDGKVNRRRVKACGENLTYEVSDGFPLNPAGRTGLTGRGILPRYGPNHMMSVIFVWETAGKVSVLKKSSRNSYVDGFITGYINDTEEQPFADVPLKHIRKSLMQQFNDTEKVNKILKKARKRFVKLIGGSVPSSLETDHAWIELEMFLVPCKKTKKLCTYGLSKMQDEFGLRWYDVETHSVEEVNRNVTTVIDSRQYDHGRYSIFCEEHDKTNDILRIIIGSILLIGGISASIALSIAFGAAWAIGLFVGFCIGSNGLMAIGAALYYKFAQQ